MTWLVINLFYRSKPQGVLLLNFAQTRSRENMFILKSIKLTKPHYV